MDSGVSTKPNVFVFASSGLRSRLPPPSVTQVSAGHSGISPYCAGVTPLRWQSLNEALGVGPEQGSWPETLPSDCGAKSSLMLGARTARLKLARNLSAEIGAYCSSNL